MFLGGLPDGLQVWVIHRSVFTEQWLDCYGPLGRPPLADLAHRLIDSTRGGDDHAFEACRELPTKVGHIPMIGPDQPYFKLGIRQAHDAGPAPVDQQMHIGSFLIHVLDTIRGLIVLHPWSGSLRPPPGTTSAGE